MLLAMQAADAAFDSPLETLAAVVSVVGWPVDAQTFYVRARDTAGAWGAPASKVVNVVDGAPPAAVIDLSAGMYNGELVYEGGMVTSGTTIPQLHEEVIDLGDLKRMSTVAIHLFTPREPTPKSFSILASVDGNDWTELVRAESFKPVGNFHVWQFESAEYRYIKIIATSVRHRDGRYYAVLHTYFYDYLGSSKVIANWTAPADDGSNQGSGAVTEYDMRYSYTQITPGNFAACPRVIGMAGPSAPGSTESADVTIGAYEGPMYLAIKSCDDVGSWSGISNIAITNASLSGYRYNAPADIYLINPGVPPVFEFNLPSYTKPNFIEFSSMPGFTSKPIKSDDGHLYKTKRFPVRPGFATWTPSAGQWKTIKKLIGPSGALYWRLSGKYRNINGINYLYGPTRTAYFVSGDIDDMALSSSHVKDAEESIYPKRYVIPAFTWTNNTNGMVYFYIDISTDPSIPIRDRKRTITIARRGATGTSYTPTTGEWKKIRRLATWYQKRNWPTPAEGVLYWRLRAATADKTLKCVSPVKTLVVDGGAFSGLVQDTDPATETPRFSWTHTGEGVEKFCLEISINDQFEQVARYTLKIPPRAAAISTYTLSSREVTKLQNFAVRNSVSVFHWRVRGEDGDRSFVIYSDSLPWVP